MYGIHTLSELQHKVIRAFAANPVTVVSFPRQHGASTVLACIAADTAKSGKRVLLIEPTLYGYETMQHQLRAARNVKVVCGNGSKLDPDHEHYDCILLDSADVVAPELFFDSVIPRLQCRDVRFLAIGAPTESGTDLVSILNRVPNDKSIHRLRIEIETPRTEKWLEGKKMAKLRALYEATTL
jgi:Mrp family chromosome partitioning ATPase